MSFLDRSLSVGGREVPTDLRRWDPATRHLGSLVAIGAASVLVLLGIVAYLVAPGATWVTWALVVLLVLLLLLEGGVVLAGVAEERRREPRLPGSFPAAPEEEASAALVEAPAEAPRSGGQVLTLQCSECGTVFDLHDDGTRPLVHRCPGCDAEGVLDEADLPPLEDEATPASLTWDEPEAEAAPAAAGAATDAAPELQEPSKPVKRVKLRCGGCATVFVVEDDGTRPLRHRCPGCGKTGELT